MAAVTPEEVGISLGRTLSEPEYAQIQQWIGDAELQIRIKVGDLDLLDQDALAFVVREAAAARARNPQAFQYEAIDDYRYGLPAESRKVTILDEWWEMLSPTTTSAAFSTQPGFEEDTVAWSSAYGQDTQWPIVGDRGWM